MDEQQQIEAGIAALQAQRAVLGDAVVEAAVAPLRARLRELHSPSGARAGSRQTLRHVSVLFLDVVGSTSLASVIDPEDVHELMDSTLAACTEVVCAHGGTVLQYAGDSVLAAFGTPQAREDDTECAVRCGLALLPLGRALGERALREHNHGGCDVRVGIHTGPVLLGGGVDAEGTIRGVTVNLAARMEQSAPPGHLRISQATWSQVRGAFDMEEQPPLMVKGSTEPLRTWLVQAVRPRSFRAATRGIDGLETPMVGRDAELQKLRSTFERVVVGRERQAVTLLADAGLGKSRLLIELQHSLDASGHDFWLLQCRAQAGAQLQPYGVLRDLLAWRLQIADSDSAEVARSKLVEGLRPWLAPVVTPDGPADALLQAQALGQLLGMDFSADPALAEVAVRPRRLRDLALDAFAAWLRALAASDDIPVLMFVDDLQWADDASLDALQELQARPRLPLLLVCSARPTLLDRRPAWGEGWERHERIVLGELAGPDQAALTRALLGRLGAAPAELLSLIERHAAGNPFYAEELVKMFIDEGVIEVGADGWQFHAARLRPDHLPGTLTGVLQARLDALAGDERHALQLASVVGPVFWDSALAALDADAPDRLDLLRRRALVHARPGSSFEGAAEQAFQHHLLHQVTYETVLKAERQAGHACAAAWLAERAGTRSDELLGVIAAHYERAGQPALAFDWYERAAKAALARYAQTAVIANVERALALPPPEDQRRVLRLLRPMTVAADVLGLRELQAETLARRRAMAERLGDDEALAAALSGAALLADRMGDREGAGALAQEGLVLAERIGKAADAAVCWGELAWLSIQRGEIEQALQQTEHGLAWARRARDADPAQAMYEMQLLAVLAFALGADQRIEQQRDVLLQTLALAQARNEMRVLCSAHMGLADAALALADEAAARHHVQALADIAQLTGEVVHQGGAHRMSALIDLAVGLPQSALVRARESHVLYAGTGARDYIVSALVAQGLAQLQMAQPEAALKVLRAALVVAQRLGDVAYTKVCRVLRARAHTLRDDAAAAMAEIAAAGALDEANALGHSTLALYARVALWQACARLATLQAAVPEGEGAAAMARHQLRLAAATLKRHTDRLQDPEVRQRVLQLPLHWQIAEGCEAAGLPGF